MAALGPKEVLRRVLVLEREQGYGNRAAVGGMERFVRQQVERATSQGERIVLQATAGILAAYSPSTVVDREKAVRAALTVLAEISEPVSPAERVGSKPSTASKSSDVPKSNISRAAPPVVSAVRDKEPRRPSRIGPGGVSLDTPLRDLKGMKAATAEALQRINVCTVLDLLYHFPRAHYDYTDTRSISRMRLGQKTTLVGTVRQVRTSHLGKKRTRTTVTLGDDSGTVRIRWWNKPYLEKTMAVGVQLAVSGEPVLENGFLGFEPRDYEIILAEDLTHTARLVPMYALTKGLFQRSLRALVRKLLNECAASIPDHLPTDLVHQFGVMPLPIAVAQYHFPDHAHMLTGAERRLAFDELLLIQLGLMQRKQAWQIQRTNVGVTVDNQLHDQFRRALPFTLTGAQERVIQEIFGDLRAPVPMSRLLQGDVGSGKTAVAAAALLQVARAGSQGVLMAPTEILAEQHSRTVGDLLSPFGVRCQLLTGSTARARRREILREVEQGSIDVLIGTHALIQEDVAYQNLGLAITDEQHRFGVEQRATLRRKGLYPHTLAMTATPIPRTLAMTIYSDLDISTIDEMPPGRLPVITTWARTPGEAYGVVRDELSEGGQAFVICPVIEESADSDMRSVLAEYRDLQEHVFPNVTIALLHGKMKAAEKDATLEAFREGASQILVATSVIEVGIDIPRASTIVIRDAHRFGLAQLHQFRGRVGRGGQQGYCVLLSPSEGDDARDRLEALSATEDGFALAEEDLRLRGPGEFWGTRQSGLPALRVAKLGDIQTIDLARRAAAFILKQDSMLAGVKLQPLRQKLERFWAETADLS